MAYLGGIHFWWPKMTGRMYSELLGKLSALTGLPRFQPDIFPAVRARLPGHAAPLPRVSGRISGPERHVHGRRSILAVGYVLAARLSFALAAPARAMRAPTHGVPRAWSGRPTRLPPPQLRGACGRDGRHPTPTLPKKLRPSTETVTSLHNEDDIGLHGIEPRMVDDGFKLEGVGDSQQAARDHLKPVLLFSNCQSAPAQ